MEGPSSLGREWVEKEFMPVLEKFDVPAADKLRTVCEHIALRIASTVTDRTGINAPECFHSSHTRKKRGPLPEKGPPSSTRKQEKASSMLITGGGAKNDFLSGLISRMAPLTAFSSLMKTLVDYKEAIIFALLGVLRISNQVNCLSSVTGARHDNSGGVRSSHPEKGKLY
jgi:anhydro-N-acetylmuramic acid kinase